MRRTLYRRNRRKITRRNAKRLRRGGAKLGEGQYGIAFRPPLRCEGDEYPDKMDDRHVGKVLPKTLAEKELANGLIISGLDPSGLWSAPATVLCTLAEGEGAANIAPFVGARAALPHYGEPMRQIIMPYAGKSLYHLLVRDGAAFNESMFGEVGRFDDLDHDNLDQFVRFIKDFLPTIKKLNKTWLHGDLHPGNIAWDGQRLRMIDFGEMLSFTNAVNDRTKYWSDTVEAFGAEGELKDVLLEEVINDLILNEARSRDVATLFAGVMAVIGSRWVNTKFPGRFNEWLTSATEVEPKMYNDYVVLLLTLP